VILSFRDADTQDIFDGVDSKRALEADRRSQHSIRINDQYRICFVWTDSGPDQVEIVDYHS